MRSLIVGCNTSEKDISGKEKGKMTRLISNVIAITIVIFCFNWLGNSSVIPNGGDPKYTIEKYGISPLRFVRDILPYQLIEGHTNTVYAQILDESLIEIFDKELDSFLTHNRIWNVYITYDIQMECAQNGISTIEECKNAIVKRGYKFEQPYARVYMITRSKQIHKDERLLFDRLEKLQFPASGCRDRKFLMLELPPYGLGSVLHLTQWPINFAIEQDKTIVLDGKDFRYHPSGGDISAYTLPFSSCDIDDIKNKKLVNGNTTNVNEVSRFYWYNRNFIRTYIPVGQWRDRSVLWWVSFTGAFTLYPNHVWRRHNQNLLTDMYRKGFLKADETPYNGPADCIFIHVRHGDKYVEAKLLELNVYMKAARHLVSSGLASNRVFIMSDDECVIHNNTKDYENEFQFYSLNEPRYNGPSQNVLGTPDFDRIETGMRLMSQIKVGAEMCKYFIGTGSSNVGRLVLEFMVNTYGERVIQNSNRWISLDGTWEEFNIKNW
jgi:hypothetical protein